MSKAKQLINKIADISTNSWGLLRPLTFDCETTMEGPDSNPMPYGGINKAKVLCWAYRHKGNTVCASGPMMVAEMQDSDLLVGHNLKFDWQHLSDTFVRSFLRSRRKGNLFLFWDTMIAEYILTAQRSKFASLGELVAKYCPTRKKGDIIESIIARGGRTQDIPLDDLKEYAKNDVQITEEVAKAQWSIADAAQRRLIIVHSNLSIIYAEGELAGLGLNVAEAVNRHDRNTKLVGVAAEALQELLLDHAAVTEGDAHAIIGADVDQFCTPSALSALMFGVPAKLPLKALWPKPVGRSKYAHATMTISTSWGVLDPKEYGATKHKKSNMYTLDEKCLEKIIAKGPAIHAEIAKCIIQMREAEKKATTYYGGLLEHHAKFGDQRIHHTINTTSTNTGRSSSSNPNAQNQPEEVRQVFIPAEEDSQFVEFDFKQLEMIALAYLSGDYQLIHDLCNGVDIHYEVGLQAGTWVDTSGMTKDKRRQVKGVDFGLIYGGGAKGLAEQAGMDVGVVAGIINGFYARYPGVRDFHESVIFDVTTSASEQRSDFYTFVRDEVAPAPNGTKIMRIMQGEGRCYTGRSYAFEQQPDGKFSPTNIKNYIVQGFATGDLVPLALLIVDMLLPEGRTHLKLAVHDSGLIEAPKSKVGEVLRSLQDLPNILKWGVLVLWGPVIEPPLNLEVEVKDTWGGTPVRKEIIEE